MEIRELALRVLLGTDLDDKLVSAGRLSDRDPGAAIRGVAAPGRPPGLGLHEIDGRAPFPRPGQLDRDEARAAALHSFANHELLAMELMALTLLRFPDAPRRFRRGLAVILGEEQRHFRLYLDRLGALGVAFGALPVNRYFWDSLAAVPSVAAFNAAMSLCFEAANLDHARTWGQRFAEAGDAETAAVLATVYADELGHVRHGLRWFKREIDPEADLWGAFEAALLPPLTPARARGERLCVEARRAAGFPEEFITALAAYRHSKGRPPVVRLFNPDSEAQVAFGAPGYAPPAVSRDLAADLDLLPVLVAASDDVVVARQTPDPAFLASLEAGGVAVPQIVCCADPRRLGETGLGARKLSGLDPWGWSPEAADWLAPLAGSVVGGGQGWRPDWRPLYDKGWAAGQLQALLAERADPRLSPIASVGRPVASLAALAEARRAFAAAGYPAVVIKPAFGTAGRGALRLREGEAARPERLEALWAAGPGVVEPWLDRRVDLSIHLDVSPEGEPRYRGLIRFFTTPTGRFLAVWLGGALAGLAPEEARFLSAEGQERRWLDSVARAVTARVGGEAAARGYAGPIGVDALVHQEAGGLRLRPLVEVNPRRTMGRVGLALRGRVAHGASAIWAVLTAAELARAGHRDLRAWAASRPAPARDAAGRLGSGVWFTTDPGRARAFVSAVSAGPDLAACWAGLGVAGHG